MSEPTFTTVKQGALRGVLEDGIRIFKGVPFAAPPVGDLRWRAPREPASWQGVRPATEFSAAPMQRTGNTAGVYETCYFSEDCLYLNVWAPEDACGLPVYVWFYGGSYQGGRADDPTFDGTHFAKMGIVSVTVNYRVGVFGFLCHPDMAKEGPLELGNFGVQDQIAALRWIRENIAAFGGDPGKVTIGGHSAGSASVNNLMVSPLSIGLFRGAINESGDVLQPERDITFEQASEGGLKLQEVLGLRSLDEMREVPAERFQRKDFDLAVENRVMCTPVIDGTVIPEAQANLLLTNRCAKVPAMIGTCQDEGSGGGPGYRERIMARFGFPDDLYPAGDPMAVRRLARDYWYGRHVAWIDIRANVHGLPTWHYNYAHRTEPMGAQHGTELPFVFGTLGRMKELHGQEFTPEEYGFMEVMSGYWANFIKYGDPNGEGLVPWPKKGKDPVHMRLEIPCGMEPDSYMEVHKTVLPAVTEWMYGRMRGEISK